MSARLLRSRRRVALCGFVALSALGLGACSKPEDQLPPPFPNCQTIIDHIPSNVLVQPHVRFPGIEAAATASTDRRGSSLCSILSLARDGKTSLQIEVNLDTTYSLENGGGGGGSTAEVLGKGAKSETADLCGTDPTTSGSPITRSTCFKTTLDGSIASAAIVHGSTLIVVRVDATPNGQSADEFQRLLQDEASGIADAVTGAI